MGSNQSKSEGQQKVVRYLKRPKELESAIWRKQETINELKECLLPHGVRYDKGGASSIPSDRTGEIMAKVVDMEAEMDRLKKQRAAAIFEVYQKVELLEDETERKAITAIYIKGMTREKAADEVGYSLRHLNRIQKKALEHMETIIEEPGSFRRTDCQAETEVRK